MGSTKYRSWYGGAIWRGGKSDIIIMVRDQTAKRRGYSSRSHQLALEEGLIPIYDGTRRFQQANARIDQMHQTGVGSDYNISD
jgi:hypothetical protein